MKVLSALVCSGALAFAADGLAQSAEERSMKDDAIADLAYYFQHAERTVQLPSSASLVWLMAPVRRYTSPWAPKVALCSVEVLALDYSLPPLDGRPASRIEPDRMLSNVDFETYYRVPASADDCATQAPSLRSTLWFRKPDG